MSSLPSAKDSGGIRRILINSTHSEELRVATISGQRLDDIDIEYINKEQKKSNIYLAIISRIEPSLEAVFINYGTNKHGFLPLKEIEKSYFLQATYDPRQDLKKILREGQEILIQVEKEERGNKGAALTTYISLAGCYLVLMPNNPKAGGISRRIEGEERSEMKDVLNSLNIPDGMSVIIRTAGLGKQASDLQWDLDVLLQHWQAIKTAVSKLQAPCLLHQESNVIIRAIRDNLRPNIKEILIDNEDLYYQAKDYVELLRKDSKNIVKLYKGDIPIFTKFHVESQIEEAYQHEIRLPSGGSIVFDRTEALTAIDINSAQSTKGHDIENTAFNTNIEACEEIARQLRLRDVGGLIVIDFIDMSSMKNQREVENKLREALQNDRARIQISRISRFGLLEMSRQRLKSSLGENTQITCSRCSGTGSVRTIESLSLSLIRLIEEEALKSNTIGVTAQLPLELCAFLSNEKRTNITEIEERSKIKIVLIPNQYYIFPNYKITRIKSTDSFQEQKSYNIKEMPDDSINQYPFTNIQQSKRHIETAVIKQTNLVNPHTITRHKPNLLKRLWTSLFAGQLNETNKTNKTNKTNEVNQRNETGNRDNKPFKKSPEPQQQLRTADPKHNKKRHQQPTRDNQIKSNKYNYNKDGQSDPSYLDVGDNLNNEKQKSNVLNTSKHPQPNKAVNKFVNKSSNKLNKINRHKDSKIAKYDAADTPIESNQDNIGNIQDSNLRPLPSLKISDQLPFTSLDEAATETISITPVNKPKTLDLNNLEIKVSIPTPIKEDQEHAVIIAKKRTTDRIKVTAASSMHKRSFNAKRKLRFEINKNQISQTSNNQNIQQSEQSEQSKQTDNYNQSEYLNNVEHTDSTKH